MLDGAEDLAKKMQIGKEDTARIDVFFVGMVSLTHM